MGLGLGFGWMAGRGGGAAKISKVSRRTGSQIWSLQWWGLSFRVHDGVLPAVEGLMQYQYPVIDPIEPVGNKDANMPNNPLECNTPLLPLNSVKLHTKP